MGKYNGPRLFQTSTLVAALVAAGCAGAPRQATYPLTVPASTPPASTATQNETIVPTAPLRSDAPLQYVVKKGDTLWDIAQQFLLDAWQWPEIWYVNDQVRNPHLIYPGDVLTLISRDGRTMLTIGEAGPNRLSPRIRTSDLADAIPTIPIDAIRDFLKGPRLVTREELRRAPYILSFVDPHIIGGASDDIYIKNLPHNAQTEYEAVRLGEPYVDPDSGQTLGQEALPVGRVEIRAYGTVATGRITSSEREARAGDPLLKPKAESFDANFYPHAPERPVKGRILTVYDGVTSIGQYMVVAINKGAVDGIEPGHVLSILQADRSARDPHTGRREALPDAFAGRMLIFKTESRVSYGLIMSAVRAIHVLDKVEKPVSGER